jgi:hypothetical protein
VAELVWYVEFVTNACDESVRVGWVWSGWGVCLLGKVVQGVTEGWVRGGVKGWGSDPSKGW